MASDILAPVTTAEFSFLAEMPEIDRRAPKWHCTGEYLQRHRPDVYQAILDALCEPGISIRAICRAYHVSHNTVASIEEREAANLDTRKKGVLRTALRVMRLSAERAEELAPEASMKDASITFGIFSEKVELLSGNATQRIESIDGGRKLHAQFLELHETLMKQADARVIGSDIGFGGGNGPANGRMIENRTQAGEAAAGTVQSDSQTDDLPKSSEESAGNPAKLTDNLGARSDPLRQGTGEGGVRSADPPLPNSEP